MITIATTSTSPIFDIREQLEFIHLFFGGLMLYMICEHGL